MPYLLEEDKNYKVIKVEIEEVLVLYPYRTSDYKE